MNRVALITGVGRTVGIGAGIARQLAASGWEIAYTYWHPYDERMPWGIESGATESIRADLGPSAVAVEADLSDRALGTAQTPLGRLGTPKETAYLVDFLCSEQGGWMNGQLLLSNGGFA